MKKIHCDVTKVNPEDNYNYFFGYYDKCPWNADETMVLCHRAKRDLLYRFPNPDDEVEIGVIDVASKQFTAITTTTAWNWQQGAQLQWINWKDKECAIFNIRDNGRIVGCVYDFETHEFIKLDSSVYSISRKGDYAATVNYARLYDCRKDYGISGLQDPNYSINSPKDDGVFVINLTDNTCKMIISTADLEATAKNPDYIHNFKQRENHVMFNPSGTRFCFMHRYFTPGNIQQSRLFTSDLDGKDIRLLFEGFVSHYDWKDDNTILAWAGKRNLIAGNSKSMFNPMTLVKKCLKPIYYALGKPRILMQKIVGDSFFLISDQEVEANSQRIGKGIMYCDGHCTYSPDKKWILTDGYTDSKNRLPLFLYNTETEDFIEIGRYDTPKELDGELRIDLHPRFNHDGSKIFIDSGMSGKREMYIVDVTEITKK